ncbi:hypothetical protein DMENIID0001_109630 [Sergentomyia squamirostris]
MFDPEANANHSDERNEALKLLNEAEYAFKKLKEGIEEQEKLLKAFDNKVMDKDRQLKQWNVILAKGEEIPISKETLAECDKELRNCVESQLELHWLVIRQKETLKMLTVKFKEAQQMFFEQYP